jgi:hypothetical protein
MCFTGQTDFAKGNAVEVSRIGENICSNVAPVLYLQLNDAVTNSYYIVSNFRNISEQLRPFMWKETIMA